ncbi:death-associated inhibitor of apoptosis 1-like isoform X2 [Neocloeon triangulifer]|uniref:death-associated inhibitor of apoptosis 1-like isoform X2 n=1 Tax=Neocloeon triangulifer TaxID=2078957 RepID=UPI00286ED60A|nr:death-associated inhibitor of apoptosis 1-like isoform X2 [Neocloeon triangulifer]
MTPSQNKWPICEEFLWQFPFLTNYTKATNRFLSFGKYLFKTKYQIIEKLVNLGLFLNTETSDVICFHCGEKIGSLNELADKSNEALEKRHHDISPSCTYFEPSDQLNLGENLNYKYESHRLISFIKNNVEWIAPVPIHELAKSGFYFIGPEDNVQCEFCKLQVRGWEPGDTADGEHRRWNEECPIFKASHCANVPIGCEIEDTDVKAVSVLNGSLYDGKVVLFNRNLRRIVEEALGIFKIKEAKYKKYAVLGARLKSLKNWPKSLAQRPASLAAAGFFYTGAGDRVCCFSCGLGLKDWLSTDDPFSEHAKWSCTCDFVILAKGVACAQSTDCSITGLEKEKGSDYQAVQFQVPLVLHFHH